MISTGTGLLGYNMYAYCNNNPVMYVDPEGNILIFCTIVAVVLAVSRVFLKEDRIKDDTYVPESFPESKKQIDEQGESNLYSQTSVESLSSDRDYLNKYVDAWASDIESRNEDFLNAEIDRLQLYCELKFHIVMWDKGLDFGAANPADINIYSNGAVIDPRPFLNWYVRFLYEDEYERKN